MKGNNKLPTENQIIRSLQILKNRYSLRARRAEQLIGRLTEPVTPLTPSRFIIRDEGRSFISNWMTQIDNLMNTTIKIGLAVLVVVLVVVWGYSRLSTGPSNYATTVPAPEAVIPAATGSGNIDVAVDAILASAASEQATVASEENDASLITAENESVSNFGQSYNENNF